MQEVTLLKKPDALMLTMFNITLPSRRKNGNTKQKQAKNKQVGF